MLESSKFIEKYRRAENPLTTNKEKLFSDREGKFIFTTPIFDSPNLVDVDLGEVGITGIPKEVNIIIDSIALFSTNPKISNFLPLSIGVGTDSLIEFAEVTFSELDSYKILVDPPITLDTIGNRRYTRQQSRILYEAVTNVDILFDVGQSREFIYSLVQTVGSPLPFVTKFNKFTSALLSEQTVDFTIPPRPRLLTNNFQAVLIYKTDAGPTKIYDLDNPTIVDPNITFEIDSVTANWELREAFVVENILFVRFQDVDVNSYLYYVKNPVSSKYTRLVNVTNPSSLPAGVIRTTIIDVNSLYISKRVANRYEITLMDELADSGNIEQPLIRTIVRDARFTGLLVSRLFWGGKDKREFTLILRADPATNIWVYSTVTDVLTQLLTNDEFDLSLNAIKQYNNIIYLGPNNTSNRELITINLDTGIIDRFPAEFLGFTSVEKPIYNFSDYDFLVTGPNLTNQKALVTIAFGNERLQNVDLISNNTDFVTVKKAYRLSKWYDQRAFPFNKDTVNTIKISLPENVSIKEMELFKFIIDYRIRYTKEVEDIYQIGAVDTESKQIEITDVQRCRQRFSSSKCGRDIGDVNRVLGYVDDDFSVQEFLNLYKTT